MTWALWCVVHSSASITLTRDATRLAPFLGEFSRVAGRRLTASDSMADELICVRLIDVPTEQAVSRIANAMEATWRPTGDGRRLIRTVEQSDRRARRFAERRTDLARFALERLATEPVRTWNEAEARRSAQALRKILTDPAKLRENLSSAHALSPIDRDVRALAKNLPLSELAAVEPGRPVVWSTDPKPRQIRIATSRLGDLLSHYAAWSRAVDESGARQIAGTTPEGAFMVGVRAKPVERVVIRASQLMSNQPISVNVWIIGANGARLAQGSTDLPSPFDRFDSASASKAEPCVRKSEAFLAAEREVALGSGSSGDGLRDRLKDPVRIDPVGPLGTEPLITYAQLRGSNLVAAVNERFVLTPYLGRLGTPLDQFLRFAELHTASTIEDSDGWIVVRPNRPGAKYSRVALRDAIRRDVAGEPLSLEERGAVANALPDPRLAPLAMFTARLASGDLFALYGSNDPSALRLYGLLSPDQRVAARRDGVPIERLTSDQRALVDRIVFGGDRLAWTYQGAPGRIDEPTECLAEGLSHGWVQIEETSEIVVQPVAAGSSKRAWLSSADLASAPTSPAAVRLGRRVTSQLTIHANETLSCHFTLVGGASATSGEVQWADVPAEFRKAVESDRAIRAAFDRAVSSSDRSAKP